MAARPSFSRDSRAVSMPLPNSILLKDYLVDDLSSCSSNGFRSYPRQQCCNKVRYLIEIDLSIKLPPSNKQFLKINSKPKHNSNSNCLKSKLNLRFHKASAAVVNVFKKFQFSGSGSGPGNRTKPKPKHNFLHFWKQTRSMDRDSFQRLNSFDESIKRNDNINMNNNNNIFTTLTTTNSTAEMKTSGSNSNSFTSSESYFTATTNTSTTGGYSNMIVAQNDVVESEQLAPEKMNTAVVTVVTATSATGNAKKKMQGEEKDIFCPISVIDFPCDRDNDEEEDEVTSPYQHSPFYAKGCKRKLMSKAQRTKSLARLNPVRLEDRITLSESRTHGSILEPSLEIQRKLAAEKKAIALLQLLKATMSSHDLSKSPMTERVLLGFFTEQFIEGGVSNYVVLQEAKDWINGQTNDILEYQYNKLTYIKEMEKGVKWLEYNEEETREVVSELEYEVFTSLVEEMLLEFYL